MCRSLGLSLPRPEEPPPAPWWNTECDYSLLVGIVKHGESEGKLAFVSVVGACTIVNFLYRCIIIRVHSQTN